jgi:hypothetical protein
LPFCNYLHSLIWTKRGAIPLCLLMHVLYFFSFIFIFILYNIKYFMFSVYSDLILYFYTCCVKNTLPYKRDFQILLLIKYKMFLSVMKMLLQNFWLLFYLTPSYVLHSHILISKQVFNHCIVFCDWRMFFTLNIYCLKLHGQSLKHTKTLYPLKYLII